MKLVHGIYLPDADEHFPPHLAASPKIDGKGTYQLNKYKEVMKHVAARGLAVDIGGHVGLWAMNMVRDFARVWSFEPIQMHRDCFQANLAGASNVKLFPYALSNQEQRLYFDIPADNTGHTQVTVAAYDPEEALEAQKPTQSYADAVTLDSVEFPVQIDLLKIDVEGFEYNVLEGALETLRDHKPTIIIEQKPNNAERFGRGQRDAVKLLRSLGMREVTIISGDHIMVW